METNVNLSKSPSSDCSLTKSSSSSSSNGNSVSELDADADTNVIYQRHTNEGSSTDENEWKKSVSNNGSEEYVYREGFYIETKQVSTMTEEIVQISNENAEYYKGLYQYCKRQLTALETTVKAADTKYTSIVQKYRDLKDNYNAMSLTSTNATEVKDNLIISLNKTVEEYSEKFSVLITEHESKVHEYEDMLSAKNKILSSLSERDHRCPEYIREKATQYCQRGVGFSYETIKEESKRQKHKFVLVQL